MLLPKHVVDAPSCCGHFKGKKEGSGFIILKKKGYFGKVKLMEDDKESNRCSVWSWKHDFHSGAKMVN